MFTSELIDAELNLGIEWLLTILGAVVFYKGSRLFARDYQYHHSIWLTTFKVLSTNVIFCLGIGFLGYTYSMHYIAIAFACCIINLCGVFMERYRPTKWSDRSYRQDESNKNKDYNYYEDDELKGDKKT